MAGEGKRYYGSPTTLQNANGSAISNNAIGQATSADYDFSTLDYPHAFFTLTYTPSAAPTANRSVEVVIMPLDVDGTTDTVAPTATYLPHIKATFRPSTDNASQTLYAEAFNVPRKGRVYLMNNDTGVSVGANWTLKVTPFTIGPS